MSLFKRRPNVGALAAQSDLAGLLKAAQSEEEAVRRTAAERAVMLAIEGGHQNEIHATAQTLAAQGARGDDVAIEILVRILRRDFKDSGPAGNHGTMVEAAKEALAAIGPRAVPAVLPMLDDEEWLIANPTVWVLGRARDVSVVPSIVARALREKADGRLDSLRMSCGVACMNLFNSDRNGFVEVASAMGVEERKFASAAAKYVGAAPGAASADLEASELAKKIYPEGHPSPTPKQAGADARHQRELDRKARARQAMQQAEERRKSEGTRPKLP